MKANYIKPEIKARRISAPRIMAGSAGVSNSGTSGHGAAKDFDFDFELEE